MPEIGIQTDEFVVLSKDDIKKLPPIERREYKIELRNYKKEIARKKYNDYMRNYMKTYAKMKYKYDPAFREKQKQASRNYRMKLHKNNTDNIDEPKTNFLNNFLSTNIIN